MFLSSRSLSVSRTFQPLLRHSSSSSSSSNSNPKPPHGVSQPEKYFESKLVGEAYMKENGWDMGSLVEQDVVWGEMDSFKHLNNVMSIRYFETGRMAFVGSLIPELPVGSEQALIRGEGGIGVILAGIQARYKRPVTFPDTLLVAHRPISVTKDRVLLESICWSYSQRCVVTSGTADMVTYDYENLKKADMPIELFNAFEKRMPKKKE